jgi:hypothetical protein
MSEISQIGAFDAEIIETSRRIERLVQEHAPFTQIEDEQYKLSSLMNQKRLGLYQAKDPSYYVDQFIRCLSAEDRRAKAAELAEGALASINAILESDDQIANPEQLEIFTSVVEFFRYFAAKDEAGIYDSDATDEEDVPALPVVPIEANVLCKITSVNLAHALVEHEYLTEENARLFLNRLKGRTTGLQADQLPIAWNGDIHSAATMFTLASNLDILFLGSKKNPNSTEQRTTVASAVLHTFSFSIGRPLSDKNYTKLIYRHTKEARDSVETFYDAVESEHADQARNQNLGKDDKDRKPYKPLKSTEELVGGYYNVNTIHGVGERIRNQCRFMDFEILDLFNDLIMNED